MPATCQRLAADRSFWPSAAQAVLAFARNNGADGLDLRRLTWVVPAGAQVAPARNALHAALGGHAFIPPRVQPWAAWLGLAADSGLVARVELFQALRGNAWVVRTFGAQPAMLWALARDIALLADEMTLFAAGDAAFDDRWQASLARHYGQRAARALQAPAQLVLQLWRARRSADDGAAATLRALAARAAELGGPLVYLGGALASAGETDAPSWEAAFLQRVAERVPLLWLVADAGLALRGHPVLAAAWPELVDPAAAAPLAERGAALRGQVPARPLDLVGGLSLEDTAGAVAQQTLDWLRDGCRSIALVALDRLVARRVRALLERAEVLVLDETGWKLSTTSAAAALMRWFDLVRDDLYWRDLLDWLKSSFTLAEHGDKAALVACVERAIRGGGAVQGARAIRRALADRTDDPAGAAALELINLIERERTAMLRAPATLAGQLRALRAAMTALGLRAGLACDAVGRAVLAELDAIEADLGAHRGRFALADMAALLAARFEEAAFVDRTVESPVVMVSLAAVALRPFDAAVLIGADAAHLPAAPADLLFMSNAVRADLGLPTAEAALREQAAQLATLLTTSPRVMAVWRTRIGDEPNPLSPLLQRLQLLIAAAGGDELQRNALPQRYDVASHGTARPQPGAAALLPQRIAASHAQSLVDCPYQFYARRLLGLQEPDDVIELPDKRDFGLALHEVLKRFHSAWGAADFATRDAAALAASLREHARAVFAPQLERAPGMLAFERRFDGLVEGYVAWLQQHAADGWRWQASEQPQRSLHVLVDGRSIELGGRLDRIDVAADGSLGVIDYKARTVQALKGSLRVAGEDIQLPFYGLLLPQRPAVAEYLSFDRPRDDDGGVHAVAPPGSLDALVDAVDARLRSDLDRIAAGAALPAIGSDAVCNRCEMRGLCRRDHWTPIVRDDEQ